MCIALHRCRAVKYVGTKVHPITWPRDGSFTWWRNTRGEGGETVSMAALEDADVDKSM